jgi:2-polyprenyl-3-methyl-5-hydroxy-6-metoxy-1,4-benzoquinol methylase
MDSYLDKLFRWLRVREIKKYVPQNSVVCDIGCGKDFYFLKNISSFITLGIGLDEEVSNYRGQKYNLRRQKIIKEIPLESESCDAVVMAAVLEHMIFPQEILNESFRILKPGRDLILTTPAPAAKPILNFLANKVRLIDKGEIEDHKNYFSVKDIRQMLEKSGFRPVKIKSYLFELFLNNLIVAQK